ncbi:serine--tRNA ligase [Candidatus Pantoea edessiphila]|uniref:Serine--tRNA ligase n=1 Tax=Candidatus Pantoea edessiphila TaxID=2044610 RepID=A0A2P5SZ20_9GAMM|nr:serine--tRNA ligase [Candidatus Pantoea edessiphila]MBK4775324.1 serine--tRNA ligase [Pantoea sp. Edef]PPI87540.1 serine--tRNA ligase [Candidatus Pantoea edessiphila]
MLDPYLLRKEPYIVAKKLIRRGFVLDSNKIIALENNRKNLQVENEQLNIQYKIKSQNIGKIKRSGENINKLCQEIKLLKSQLDYKKSQLKDIEDQIKDFSLKIPNLPSEEVPSGSNKHKNITVSYWGKLRDFNFNIKDHVELGAINNGLDFASASKITGARFVVMQGKIAYLHRALGQFMIDLHVNQHGYLETYVPYIVNQDSLYGTGQLPKFGDDIFHINILKNKSAIKKYSLIPTSEVPLINFAKNKIFNEENLPIKLTAHTPCFRSEAGSYGRDVRGLIRMHQFDKVELIQIVKPEKSVDALEELTKHAEKVLQLLNLPYRKILLCAGDMSFGATKTYDLEVWFPAQNTYREISSCSNMSDFQARRIKARYRSEERNKKILLTHTLNGSALAVGRTLAAVMENYQQIDGSIMIPNVLISYMNNIKSIY